LIPRWHPSGSYTACASGVGIVLSRARLGIVLNGSPLFNGLAELGPSNIRGRLLC